MDKIFKWWKFEIVPMILRHHITIKRPR